MGKARLALVTLVALTLAYPAARTFGQAVFGSISGTVTDSSGAVVPAAKITITDVGKGVSFSTTANEAGVYEQTHLIVGVYRVRVEKEGFQASVQENVQVNVDAVAHVDVVLQLGAVTQTVEVTAAVPLLKTEKTDVAVSFSDRQVAQLPIFNRNFTQFELLTPGTQRLGWQHAASENPQSGIQIMVNGQHFSGTSFQLDGTDNQDPILGIIVINPNLNSVTEAKITTQDYDSEFGQATAGVVTSQTKSGSNDLHGDVFYFGRTSATQARDPFANSLPLSPPNNPPACGDPNVPYSQKLQNCRFLPVTIWNQFGGDAGYRIKKDKNFIFGDYQGTRRTLGGSVLTRVPTAAERNGNLSEMGLQIFNPFDANGHLIPCPTAANCPRQLFAGSVIPSTMLSTQAQNMLKYWPLPNLTPSSVTAPNYSASGTQVFNTDGFDVRDDQYQTEKLHIFGRYSFQQFKRQGGGAYGLLAGGPAFNVDPSVGGFAGASSVRNQSIASGFDYTFRPDLLTDFRFGFFRYRVAVAPNGLGTSPAADAGIPGLNLDKTFTSGMPAFFIHDPGFPDVQLGYALGVNQCNCLLDEQEQGFQWVNNWTYIRGKNTIKFGADIRYAMNLRVPSDTHRAGELSYAAAFTEGVTGGTVGGGSGLAAFLLGDTTSFGRYVSNITNAAERQKRWFFYGQDTIKFTPKLTVNAGLRWELYFPQTVNGTGNGGWLNLSTGEIWTAGVNGINMSGDVYNTFGNFAPRLGIAYQFNSQTVLRMGYGRSFQIGTFGSIFGHTVTQNLPVLANQQVNPPAAYADVFNLSVGPPPLDPATILQNNCNLITDPTGLKTQCLGSTGNPLNPNGVSPHIHPPKQRMPTVDAWNVTLQRQLTSTISAEVGYVANKGTHGFNGDGPNYDINTPTIDGFAQGVPTNLRRIYYPRFGWTQGLNYYGNDASNEYESVQVKVEKRFSSGLSLLAHYTYAHATQYDGEGYYIWNASLVRGPSDFQRRNVFNLNETYELPFGRGKHWASNVSRPVDLLIGGWQLNSVWTWMSGSPFTPGYTNSSGDRDTGPNYPNLVGNTVPSNPNQNQWYIGTGGVTLSTNGQTIGPWQRPQVGGFGNAGIDSLWGPRFFQADVSMFKNFKVTERFTAQLRAESFNTFNHPNLGQPNSTVDSSGAGQITGLVSSAQMRTFQFGIQLTW